METVGALYGPWAPACCSRSMPPGQALMPRTVLGMKPKVPTMKHMPPIWYTKAVATWTSTASRTQAAGRVAQFSLSPAARAEGARSGQASAMCMSSEGRCEYAYRVRTASSTRPGSWESGTRSRPRPPTELPRSPCAQHARGCYACRAPTARRVGRACPPGHVSTQRATADRLRSCRSSSGNASAASSTLPTACSTLTKLATEKSALPGRGGAGRAGHVRRGERWA